MKESKSRQLANAMRSGSFVRIERRFEEAPTRGYVSSVGPKWVLVTAVNDEVCFNGFECCRIADIKRVEVDPYADFVEAALRKRRQRRPIRPRVQIGSIEQLLRSASRAFPLVTIHREARDPDVCQVGRVERVAKGKMDLLEIAPDATWHAKPTLYKVSEITRVDFGGGYEQALHLVGGSKHG